MFKSLFKIFLATGLALFFAGQALAYTSPGKPSGMINDFAGVLTGEQKQQLENKLVKFKADTGNEIAVAIVNNLSGDTVENYAVELFKEWGIGQKGKDNGVLVLVAKEDRKMRIEVGYGLEGDLTDAQSSWIIKDIMKPAFANNDFYGGLNGAVDKIIGATKGEIVPSDTAAATGGKKINFEFFFGLAAFIFMWLASILGRSKSWWLGGVLGGVAGVVIGLFKGFMFFGIISVAVLVPLGLLFDFIVSKNYHSAKSRGVVPWWIGGGGFGGGSSGGFGGFGGGSSGGGGASGDW